METNKIYFENCLDGMKKIDDNTINLIVTSPPYADATEYGKKIEYFNKLDENNSLLSFFLLIALET